jgi:hypothetical protein
VVVAQEGAANGGDAAAAKKPVNTGETGL